MLPSATTKRGSMARQRCPSLVDGAAGIPPARHQVAGGARLYVGLVDEPVDVLGIDRRRPLVAFARRLQLGGRIAPVLDHLVADVAMDHAEVVVGPRIVGLDGQRLAQLVERPGPPGHRVAAARLLLVAAVQVRQAERVPRLGGARVAGHRRLRQARHFVEQRARIGRAQRRRQV
jgi:hypothetical protein